MIDVGYNFADGEILNINKPAGWTSFDVVKKIRVAIRVNKVGHAGALDPFATGVLLICTGAATKQVQNLMNFEKEYLAEIELGKTTDTYDRTGVVLTETDASAIAFADVQQAAKEFEGEIYQTPPMYSALKMHGQRLYKLARRGEVVARPPRKITIQTLELVGFENPRVTLRVVCSKGTYIRALAHDLGARLGCGAFLQALVRTRIGPYRLAESITIDELLAKINLAR
jgi:tRNA pseudouridine55 synthase